MRKSNGGVDFVIFPSFFTSPLRTHKCYPHQVRCCDTERAPIHWVRRVSWPVDTKLTFKPNFLDLRNSVLKFPQNHDCVFFQLQQRCRVSSVPHALPTCWQVSLSDVRSLEFTWLLRSCNLIERYKPSHLEFVEFHDFKHSNVVFPHHVDTFQKTWCWYHEAVRF